MDYQLKRAAKTCAATGEAIAPGATCYSALVEEDGRFVRVDYAEQNWNGPPENAVGFWRTVVPDEAPSKPKPLDSDTLLEYFEQLCEEANPAREKLQYVMALLLLQKRRLNIDRRRCDGEMEFLQLIGSRGEGPYEVREHPLSDEERETLQSEVDAFLATASG